MRIFTPMLLAAALVTLIGCKEEQSESSQTFSTESTMSNPTAASQDAPGTLLQFTMNDIHEEPVDLSRYEGKVVMFVNVASKCGYTKQYTGLEAMYEKYKDQGLVIIGVPANNFKEQEPGTNEEILAFCTTEYNVTFPLLAKVSVKGDDTCELYQALIAASDSTGETGDVQWNFEKFLIGRDGKLVGRYRSKITPEDTVLVEAVEDALNSD